MKRVFLIGYMGSGKTTLGKAYSAATGLQFVDLDWYIEERMHKSISDLFAERGEEGFRLLEQKMLHEAGEFENVLIACGGGTPCFFVSRTANSVFSWGRPAAASLPQCTALRVCSIRFTAKSVSGMKR